ncbi:hypothetical protein DSM104299_01438 [Baekduia alba]|uniref:hypothetical protein n=1 Tax=Baekduia alba TaxID=2997333 RepID=UPI00234121F8|nr:hypothetical protein [Baekduia alba]WCB92739.1 hypothetical protein DSM104299_01438 [Baekduia alba]
MSPSSLKRLVVALVAAAAVLVPASSASALVIGIADQKPDMFADPVFQSLDVRYARLAVSWDATEHPWEIQEVDAWLNQARRNGVQPLVGFGHSRVDRRSLPTPARFKYDFRQFRARYPWVTTFATWNEANHCGEPTCHRPQLVAAYYRSIVRECPACTVLGAELLDMPNMSTWVDQYRKHLGAKKSPRYWGLHNYIDANRLRTTGTRRLLAHTTGQVWFTETGGIVRRSNRSKVTFPESAAHAAVATRWVFSKLVPLSRRITRVYLYQWNAIHGDNWDSGLVDAHGRSRPALKILRDEQRTLQRREARRAASAG